MNFELITNTSKVSTSLLMQVAMGIERQLNADVIQFWDVHPSLVSVGAAGSRYPSDDDIAVYIVDELPETLKDKISAHVYDASGKVYIMVSFHNAAKAGQLLSPVLSNAIVRLKISGLMDSYYLAHMPDGFDRLYKGDECDPVFGEYYTGFNQVVLSNFVTPNWFNSNPAEGVPFDFLESLKAPFTVGPKGSAVYHEVFVQKKTVEFGEAVAPVQPAPQPEEPVVRAPPVAPASPDTSATPVDPIAPFDQQ